MKKTLVVAAGLAVLSTGAHATVARMQALGQDGSRGSYYMDDERNAFRMANAFSGNYVYLEHGTNAAGGKAGDAEGGFFREGGSFNYGVYLNSSAHGNLGNATGDLAPAKLDLFMSGNGGFNWGARIGYASVTSDAADESGTGMDLSFSTTLRNGMNIWLSYEMGTDSVVDGGAKTGADMQLGWSGSMMDHTMFAEYSSESTTDGDDAYTTLLVGAGRTMSADAGMFFYDLTLKLESNIGHSDKVSKTSLPLTFGFETAATSWLTWRASISQSLFGALDNDGKKTSATTTSVATGASLTWGALRVDGAVSVLNDGDTGLGTNALLGNVSAVYKF